MWWKSNTQITYSSNQSKVPNHSSVKIHNFKVRLKVSVKTPDTSWTTSRIWNAISQKINGGGNLPLRSKGETSQSGWKHQPYTPKPWLSTGRWPNTGRKKIGKHHFLQSKVDQLPWENSSRKLVDSSVDQEKAQRSKEKHPYNRKKLPELEL